MADEDTNKSDDQQQDVTDQLDILVTPTEQEKRGACPDNTVLEDLMGKKCGDEKK